MPDDRSEIMMPVASDRAVQMIELEVLRQISDNLTRLNSRQDDHGKMLSDVRERVIKIESNRLDREVQGMKTELVAAHRRIDTLQADKDRRDGAAGAANWLLKNLPTIGAIVVAIFAAIVLTLKASGRL